MYPKGLVIKTAELYFYRKLPQQAIARELGVSVSSVSRILAQAVQNEIIKVVIQDTEKIHQDLGERLKNRYDLREAIVIPTPPIKEREYLKKLLGKAAATLFSRLVPTEGLLGIGPGVTVLELIESLDPTLRYGQTTLLPLIGGWGFGGLAYEVNNLVVTMAEILHCPYKLLFCPAITRSKQARKLYLEEGAVKQVIDLWNRLDMVLFSVGPELQNGTYPQLYMHGKLMQEAATQKAVGDVLGRFITEEGEEVPAHLKERIISLPLEQLANVPIRFCVAGGPEKIRSLRTALRMGWVNVLVTDYETGSNLVKEPPQTNRQERKNVC